MAEKNLWILTEERPKPDTIFRIIKEFSTDFNKKISIKNNSERTDITKEIIIKPLFKKSLFQFSYEIKGVKIDDVGKIILEIVSGTGSFVDYLVYYEVDEPDQKKHTPLYAIEETKTTPQESRNLHYQRITKFGYISYYRKINNARKLFIYSIRKKFNTIPESFVMGTRMLKMFKVKVLGLENTIVTIDDSRFKKFSTIDEMSNFKNSFAKKSGGHDTPYTITKNKNKISISARLQKGNSQTSWSDPSTGFAIAAGFIVREVFGHTGEISIVKTNFKKNPTGSKKGGKFAAVASRLDISIEDWKVPKKELPENYFKKSDGEKVGSILLHLCLEDNHDLEIIYENHAGSEQGYFEEKCTKCFVTRDFHSIKKKDGKADLIILDKRNKEIFILEGEKAKNVKKGIAQMKSFNVAEKQYCKKFYPKYKCKRFVVLYGDKEVDLTQKEKNQVIFRLKGNGQMIIYPKCPQIIKNILEKL